MPDIGRGISGAASGATIGSVFPGPGTAIGAVAGALLGLFGGGGGNKINTDEILKKLRSNIIQTGGASRKLNQAILGQNLAGASRLQRQAALGQQQNRDIEALFNTLSGAELRALQIALGAQAQQERLKALRNQQLFSQLADIGSALPALFGRNTQQQPQTGGGIDLNALLQLLQVQQNPSQLLLGNIQNPQTRNIG